MKAKLLILDDQKQYGWSLERALSRDYEVALATSLAEAKQKLAPDICGILADVCLDELSTRDRQGLEFVSWARTQGTNVPIISMSAVEDESLELDALTAGATRFLRKPVVISKLKAVLLELLQRAPMN